MFAHTGMTGPAGSLQGIVGPHHQTRGDHAVQGAFGATWIEIHREGRSLPVRRGRIGRLRGTAIVSTELDFGGPSLSIVDFAPPGIPALVRSVGWAGPVGASDRLRVRFPSGRPLPDGSGLVCEYRPGQVAILAIRHGDATAPPLPHLVVEPGTISLPAASCRDGRLSIVVATGTDVADARTVLASLGDVEDRRAETRRFWRDWLGDPPVEPWSMRWDDPRGTARWLSDLVESARVSLKLQQSLPGGGTGPMVHFKGTWARDNNGIVRGLLACGALEETRAALSYYVRASAHLGEIPNRAPLDCPTHAIGIEWSHVPVPPTEVPSWLILQHGWWLEAGGDLDLIAEHWPFLVRCLLGQMPGPNGLLPFHGDETYLHGALLSVLRGRVGPDHDLILHSDEDPAWSLEATAAFATAAGVMATLAGRVGRPAEAPSFLELAERTAKAIEAHFWNAAERRYVPAVTRSNGTPHPTAFAPVNAALLWMGYRGPSDRLTLDLATTLRRVGFGRASPHCPYDVGGTRGMLLRALLRVGSTHAPLALAHLVSSASPSGDWAEIHGPDGGPDGGYDLENPNRLRPWETGISLDALVRYFRARRPADEPELAGPLARRVEMDDGPGPGENL